MKFLGYEIDDFEKRRLSHFSSMKKNGRKGFLICIVAQSTWFHNNQSIYELQPTTVTLSDLSCDGLD